MLVVNRQILGHTMNAFGAGGRMFHWGTIGWVLVAVCWGGAGGWVVCGRVGSCGYVWAAGGWWWVGFCGQGAGGQCVASGTVVGGRARIVFAACIWPVMLVRARGGGERVSGGLSGFKKKILYFCVRVWGGGYLRVAFWVEGDEVWGGACAFFVSDVWAFSGDGEEKKMEGGRWGVRKRGKVKRVWLFEYRRKREDKKKAAGCS